MAAGNLRLVLAEEAPATPAGRIVRLLSQHGTLTAADISRMTGLSRSTISYAVARLRSSGIVADATGMAGTTVAFGRPGQHLMLNPEAGTCIGVHLGFRELKVAVADVSHSFIARGELPLPLDYSPAKARDELLQWVKLTYSRHGLSRNGLLGAGISVSAPVAPDGTVHRASIVPAWAGINVEELFSDALGTTALADNESNCSAVAEMMWGAARGAKDFIIFKVDIGIGGAIVADGRVLRGPAGGSGEFGHIVIHPGGELCRCGNRGCLETVAATGRILEVMARTHGRPFTLPEVILSAQKGDAGAERLIADIAELAGQGLARIGTMINMPLILISGALAHAGPLLLDPLKAAYEKHTLLKARDLPHDQRTKIITGKLLDDDVVLGAVGLVLRHHGRLEQV